MRSIAILVIMKAHFLRLWLRNGFDLDRDRYSLLYDLSQLIVTLVEKYGSVANFAYSGILSLKPEWNE